MPIRRSELGVLLLVEPERHLRSFDEDRPADQVRIVHHEIDRFFLRFRQRAFFPHRAARAHEIEEVTRVDVLFQEFARRRLLIDVDLVDIDLARVQKTSGVLARGSGGLRVKGRLRHIELQDSRIAGWPD